MNENGLGLKQKLNILDQIISKASDYTSTRTTPMVEVPLKCEVQPVRQGSQDTLTKEMIFKSNEVKVSL